MQRKERLMQRKERPMNDQFILTPYFLDEPLPDLSTLAGPDWQRNAPELTGNDKQRRMTALHRSLAQRVATAVSDGKRPVSVAGDCCAVLGALAGLQQAGVQPTLIWFDAHGDFNTWETTPSGFLGGMPLAMLVGRGEQRMVKGVGLTPLPEEKVILSDGRDLDPEEAAAVAASAVRHLPDVASLLTYPLPDGPLYVHFDADIVDPADAPAMSYPAPGGPTPETLRQAFQRLAATGQVVAVSVSTWNPALDRDGRSKTAVMSLLRALLG
jgi:arginase